MKLILSRLVVLCLIASFTCACKLRMNSLSTIRSLPKSDSLVYKSFLPKGAILPDTLLVKFEAVAPGGSNFYLESNISIAVKYYNRFYWYPLIMPLNSKAGYKGGLPYGYPKICVNMNQKKQLNPDLNYTYVINKDRLDKTYDSLSCAMYAGFQQNNSSQKNVFWNDEYLRKEGLSISVDSVYVSTALTYQKTEEQLVYGTVRLINNFDPRLKALLPTGNYQALYSSAKLARLRMITLGAITRTTYAPQRNK